MFNLNDSTLGGQSKGNVFFQVELLTLLRKWHILNLFKLFSHAAFVAEISC